LDRAYYPLGPYVVLFGFQSLAFVLPVLLVIVVHSFILRIYLRPKTLLGDLGRATAILVLSKIAESLPGVLLLVMAPWRVWSSDSVIDTIGIPFLIFGVGLAANALAIRIWYPRSLVPWGRVFEVAAMLAAASYLLFLLSTVVMLKMELLW
jgi:hypothetical protein